MLTRVPQDIQFLQGLKTLSLSTNRLTSLPFELSQLSGTLAELDLSINEFAEMPECVCHLTNLNLLNMSVNNLLAIPSNIGNLTSLRTLDLRNNRLTSLPSDIGNLTQLIYLSLQDNSISELPNEVGKLTMLREIYMDRNCVRALPDSIVGLKNLRKLGMWKNDLRAIPAGLDRLESLTYMDLSDNKLAELPESFSRMPTLSLVYLINNNFKSIPKLPPNVFEAHFTGNDIPTIDPCALPVVLQKLDLGQNDLGSISIQSFPEPYTSSSVVTCKGLVELHLPLNRLSGLPAILGRCNSLKLLDVSFNEFTDLPECVCSIASLTSLNVSYNRLTALPPSFAHLESLTSFNGNGNHFKKVPQELFSLTKMRDLSLAGNCIATIPAALVKMQSLTKLDLSGNVLLECVAVAYLKSLVELNIGNNRLQRLPKNMTALQSLQEICIDNNYITRLPWTPTMLQGLCHVMLTQNNITLKSETPSVSTSPALSFLSSLPLLNNTVTTTQQQQQQNQHQQNQQQQQQQYHQIAQSPPASSPVLLSTPVHTQKRFRGNSVSSISGKSGGNKLMSPKDLLNATLLHSDTAGARVVYRVDGNPEIDRALISPSTRLHPIHDAIFDVKIAWSELCGRRPDMQDALCAYKNFQGVSWQHLVGLFDGHAGSVSSRYVAKNFGPTLAASLRRKSPDEALLNTYKTLQKDIEIRGFKDGTTAVSVLISGRDIYIGNCGDSRAVLCRNGTAIDLTVDDKPTNMSEVCRIKKLGGFITANGRVNGDLALSRSLGDCALQPFVTWEPKITGYALNPEDEFIVMGCDGIWDVLSSQKAVDIVREAIAEEEANGPEGQIKAAIKLRDYAYSMGSGDNLSAIVIRLVQI